MNTEKRLDIVLVEMDLDYCAEGDTKTFESSILFNDFVIPNCISIIELLFDIELFIIKNFVKYLRNKSKRGE